MYTVVNPLAVSVHTPDVCGQVHCFSLHNKVINLVNCQDQIITLHRYNNGLSPMGWSLKSDDFDDIYELITQGTGVEQTETGDLLIGDIRLNKKCRQLALIPKRKSILSGEIPKTLFKSIKQPTGLFGPLGCNITEDLPNDLQSLVNQFLLLLNQDAYDLSPYIGLGPGLTPSYDDTVIGILAVLHSETRLTNELSPLLFNYPLSKLESLTTKISATFLAYSIQGIFTSNLLAVISLIRQYSHHSLAIKRLLNYGHTSGADLLLGIWLGALILQAFHINKRGVIC